MRVCEKINMDRTRLIDFGPINIVAFGDSVTHGSFCGYMNYEDAYWNLLKKKLNKYRDSIPVNVINAGIGGTTAFRSLDRIERDVLSHHPDLIIVCFGLNDVNRELSEYISSLRIIFERCLESGAEVIFMTPNMLNTYVSDETEEQYIEYASTTMTFQNEGRMDKYMEEAIKIAEECSVTVCDCYGRWKEMYKSGIDTTMLLSNRINHPIEEMHELFADMLYDIIMAGNDQKEIESIETMFEK